ncbi:acyl-CoA dehydrogenase [candidate division TA06 bacterium SM1_40]|uniref:Acyl-CoA dehydrogenase n=2 Tax=Bacteria division TA06 TaxID=1156500 RepID=A0A0S8JCC8_UNCT6|nr:MAG: acyl-CoA dehydrogenase [candidate division TA06 bacterium SM23_40]KPL07368.1 MAG: acyl-CoA dehydrogenase [candidate division TA06 bacterium SM1_40]
MSAFLTEQNREWQTKARDVAEATVRPLAAKYDRSQTYPHEIREGLAGAGLLGVWIDREYGGGGGSLLDLCLCVEEISKACGGAGTMYAVNALGSLPIVLSGTEEQKQKYLPDIAQGKILAAFGLSEKFAGTDAGSMRTSAVEDGDDFVINGEKKWTTNAGAADIYTVFAVTDPSSRSRRISAFIVEKETPGFEIGKEEDKLGIRCVPVRELYFRDCRVPREQILGGKLGRGLLQAMSTIDRARPGVAAQAVGLAQGALEYAMFYATRREQFGQPISSFQMIQQLLADMATKIEAARQLLYAAAAAVDQGLSGTRKLSSQAKLFASDVAMEVTTNAVQVFGGYGYMKDYPIEKYMRDAKITQIYEGTNQLQRTVIAHALIKEASHLTHLDAYIPREVQP